MLDPGESAEVTIVPEPADGTVYSNELNIPVRLFDKHITLESRFEELRRTFMGRILYNAVVGVADKQRRQAMKLPAPFFQAASGLSYAVVLPLSPSGITSYLSPSISPRIVVHLTSSGYLPPVEGS